MGLPEACSGSLALAGELPAILAPVGRYDGGHSSFFPPFQREVGTGEPALPVNVVLSVGCADNGFSCSVWASLQKGEKTMRMPSVKLCAVFLTACALAGPASPPLRAGFISNFTGNVQMSDHAGDANSPQGVVSFTVFQRNSASGSILDQLNTALGLSGTSALQQHELSGNGFDTTANYLYLYQSYTKVGGGSVNEVLVKATDGTFSSGGYLTDSSTGRGNPKGEVFVDTGSPSTVGTSSNTGLGTDPSLDDVVFDQNPATIPGVTGSKGQTLAGVTTNAAAKHPIDIDLSTLIANIGFVTFDFGASGQVVGANGTSTLLFLTSNFAPTYNEGRIHGAGVSDGDVPTAVTPEPGSFVLCGLGVGLLGFYGWRRRGLKAQPAVA